MIDALCTCTCVTKIFAHPIIAFSVQTVPGRALRNFKSIVHSPFLELPASVSFVVPKREISIRGANEVGTWDGERLLRSKHLLKVKRQELGKCLCGKIGACQAIYH